jgi:hypothetical protein
VADRHVAHWQQRQRAEHKQAVNSQTGANFAPVVRCVE